MHKTEPYYGWLKYYDSSQDQRSPYFGAQYNYDLYSDTIYGYYIAPGWDSMESETLYLKIIYADYDNGYVVIELIGEWNDAIHNDIMSLKRNIIDDLLHSGINKYVLIGENVMNFHGSDDSYYEEWFEELDDGWICTLGFREFVIDEMKNYGLDSYLNYGGPLEIENWRTIKPQLFCQKLDELISKRLG